MLPRTAPTAASHLSRTSERTELSSIYYAAASHWLFKDGPRVSYRVKWVRNKTANITYIGYSTRLFSIPALHICLENTYMSIYGIQKNGEPSCREGIENGHVDMGWWGTRCVGRIGRIALTYLHIFFPLALWNTSIVMGRNFYQFLSIIIVIIIFIGYIFI